MLAAFPSCERSAMFLVWTPTARAGNENKNTFSFSLAGTHLTGLQPAHSELE